MLLHVAKYGEDITTDEISKVKQIFQESKCPNETLKNTFKGFEWGEQPDEIVLNLDEDDGKNPVHMKTIEVNDIEE